MLPRGGCFGFALGCSGVFAEWNGIGEGEPFLQNLCVEASKVPTQWCELALDCGVSGAIFDHLGDG